MKTYIFLSFCLFSISVIYAQNLEWMNYTYSTNITALEEEGDYIWVGTNGGLAKINKISGNIFFYNKTNADLPSNSVHSIAIDGSGNKWIGTSGGLAKYDGTTWSTYNTSNSKLPNNSINSIAIDGGGNIWIGTNGGLTKYDGTNWTTYDTSNRRLPSKVISSIAIDGSSNKWIGTNCGLTKYDGTNWTTYDTSNHTLPSNLVSSIAIDGSDTIWIGTTPHWNGSTYIGGGITKFDGTNWTTYDTTNHSLPNNFVNSIAICQSGTKWIGSGNALVKYDGANWTTYKTSDFGLPNNSVTSIAIDVNSNKWIGTSCHDIISKFDSIYIEGNTLIKLNEPNWTTYTIGLLDNSVSSIAIDGNGTKWIGTNNGGLTKFDGINWTTNWTTYIPGDSYVTSITIDGSGNKWIGTWGSGFAKFDGTKWKIFTICNMGINVFYSNRISSIAIDGNNTLWIGTCGYNIYYPLPGNYYYGGLINFNEINWSVYRSRLPNDYVTSVAIDLSGNKWIGTDKGLVKFDGTNWTTYNTSNSRLPNNYVSSIAIDGNDTLWIGTDPYGNLSPYVGGGLAKFHDTTWTTYDTLNSKLPHNAITTIAIDRSGNKWIGTKYLMNGAYTLTGGGLVKFDGTNWTTYTTSNSGLPDNFVHSITIDGSGNKWIGTNGGLAVYKEGGVVSVKEMPSKIIPKAFTLFQNYPNPFNPSTSISFNLPSRSYVSLKVFDILGREVATLVSEMLFAGEHSRQWNASNMSSGIYFYRMQAGSFVETKKLVLLR